MVIRPSGLIVDRRFFCDQPNTAKKCAYIANTYAVRTGSARGVDCRCFCCFVIRKQGFSPTRWRPLLGLFQLKIAAKAALNNNKLIYCPLPQQLGEHKTMLELSSPRSARISTGQGDLDDARLRIRLCASRKQAFFSRPSWASGPPYRGQSGASHPGLIPPGGSLWA